SGSPTSCRSTRTTSSTSTPRPPSAWSSRPRAWKSTARRSRPRLGTPPDRRGFAPSPMITTGAPSTPSSSMTSAARPPSTTLDDGWISSKVSMPSCAHFHLYSIFCIRRLKLIVVGRLEVDLKL
ncbi:unnamed protein product, partial [Linum tenue]